MCRWSWGHEGYSIHSRCVGQKHYWWFVHKLRPKQTSYENWSGEATQMLQGERNTMPRAIYKIEPYYFHLLIIVGHFKWNEYAKEWRHKLTIVTSSSTNMTTRKSTIGDTLFHWQRRHLFLTSSINQRGSNFSSYLC